MAVNYQMLKIECQTDPSGIGLVTDFNAGRDQAVADSLNLVRVGALFQLFQDISSSVAQASLDPTEFLLLTDTQLNRLSILFSGGIIASSVSSVRTLANNIFSPAATFPNTRTNLLNLVRRQGSRAEILFGISTFINHYDIVLARNS